MKIEKHMFDKEILNTVSKLREVRENINPPENTNGQYELWKLTVYSAALCSELIRCLGTMAFIQDEGIIEKTVGQIFIEAKGNLKDLKEREGDAATMMDRLEGEE